jgi:hypothetical protein
MRAAINGSYAFCLTGLPWRGVSILAPGGHSHEQRSFECRCPGAVRRSTSRADQMRGRRCRLVLQRALRVDLMFRNTPRKQCATRIGMERAFVEIDSGEQGASWGSHGSARNCRQDVRDSGSLHRIASALRHVAVSGFSLGLRNSTDNAREATWAFTHGYGSRSRVQR